VNYHIGRSWVGHDVEDNCPCPQAPCGLVDVEDVDPDCSHHPALRAKSMRQGHHAEDCPDITEEN
jgi:hypothetical protein